jgi:hypothetical protein
MMSTSSNFLARRQKMDLSDHVTILARLGIDPLGLHEEEVIRA